MDSPETWGALYYRRINNMAKSGNSGSNSGSNSGNNGGTNSGNTGATNSAGMSIGFGGGLSGFSNSDQGGAGGWTGNSFGGGVNATGGGTSIGSSTGSSSSNPSTEPGQTFGEAITSGGSSSGSGSTYGISDEQANSLVSKEPPKSAQEAMENAQKANAAKAEWAKAKDVEFGPNENNGKNKVTYDPIGAAIGRPANEAQAKEQARNGDNAKAILAGIFGQNENNTKTSETTTASAISNLGTTETSSDSVLGHNDYIPGTPAQSNDSVAAPSSGSNNGMTYRGGTVSDGGTGGSISSGLTPPSRDKSSIGLGVYDPDKANYDQDNWNRGMEAQSSSLVSDEECKAFAKRAFSESSEPFKKVRVTIVKKI